MNKKILFIASHRKDRAPGQRFRFEQYFDYLSANGFDCELSFLIDEQEDKILYKHGHYFEKFKVFLSSYKKRRKDAKNKNKYDIIFIFREALMTRSIYFEKQFKNSRAKLVYDFDDAIWHQDVSDANKKISFLKNPDKISDIISLCDVVFAGNQYLADYAGQFNKNILIVPTTIDTNEYKRMLLGKKDDRICIGWSGSITTIKHFEYAISFLTKIKEKYGDKIKIKVIGDGSYINEPLEIKGVSWTKKEEIKELSEIDIGIMPLPDDEWTKGKCGLKGLQYMALEIPTVMSPIGVNSEIINDGVNGFLAKTEEEWVTKISQLIDSFEMRKKLGSNARKTVEERYSVESQKNNYLNAFNELLKR
ncbi:MAG: glycosyltransferase family 4 protein [Bacteroidia bacterium]